MISIEDYRLLTTDEVQRAIGENRRRNPLEVALDRHVCHSRIVSTQVKYLQRAETKLPSYAAVQAVLPPLAFEQASSEECARHKRIGGDSVLDLTCGLGVDSFCLSRRFRRVVALEQRELLAEITRNNLRRLGAENVEVVHASAEAYLENCTEHFDWIYVDPDRRSESGRKLVRLEECSPSVPALLPLMRKVAGKLCVKNSPLFDVDEALRLFPDCEVEVVSLGGECKEVMIYTGAEQPRVTATALGVGSYSVEAGRRGDVSATGGEFPAADYRWLLVPDVALQKARLAVDYCAPLGDIRGENSFCFAERRPEGFLGRVLAIERIEPFEPKRLKRELKGRGVEILKRDFPLAVEELMKRTGTHAGAERRVAFTRIDGRFWTVFLV